MMKATWFPCARSTVRHALTGVLVLVMLKAVASAATITFADLNPAGATESRAKAVDGIGQAGYATIGGNFHAGWWAGSAGSFVDLNPLGASRSEARGGGGQSQVGYSYFTNPPAGTRATLWFGDSTSYSNLDPGAASSVLYAATASQQGGAFAVGSALHAALWSGWAGSVVDLTPASSGVVYGLSESQQVGTATINGAGHAALWSGTPDSFIDLHPPGAISSKAVGVNASQQVGEVYFGSGNGVPHAMLWSGTAASYLDLTPAGASNSHAAAVSGTRQAGSIEISGRNHAALWSGTARSFVDLHLVLGTAYTNSVATGVWSDGAVTYVVGYAYPTNSATTVYHAILWTILEPPLLQITTASVGAATVATLAWTNNGLPCDLQSSDSVTGGWSTVSSPLTTNANWISTTVTNSALSQFFRLRAN